MELSVGVAA